MYMYNTNTCTKKKEQKGIICFFINFRNSRKHGQKIYIQHLDNTNMYINSTIIGSYFYPNCCNG